MATFTNGKYFHWAQRTAPATPYVKVYPVLPWTIANGVWVPKVKSPYQTPINVSGNAFTIRWTRQPNQTNPSHVPGTRAVATLPWPKRGLGTISGTTRSASAVVKRRVVVFTQPPQMVLVGTFFSSIVDGTYSIPGLQPGKYVVLDFDLVEGGDQALVYDQVVVS